MKKIDKWIIGVLTHKPKTQEQLIEESTQKILDSIKRKSKCCKDYVKLGADLKDDIGGTRYYVCTKCEKPCDLEGIKYDLPG